ncbi:MAG TPA: AarF/UbiB family protein [Smithellaceae bacterium]|jgi:ubiquinone biosynthesis protein|nr:AarF/UbiB family protein [Smithellaceae bacterium]
MSIFKVHEKYQELKRYGQIVRIFVRYGFGDLLQRMKVNHAVRQRVFTIETQAFKNLTTQERLRLAFEELGPTFIKFGQVLSSRPDVLSAEFVKELSKLQDNVPPFLFKDAKALIESQFGCPLTEVFDDFEEEPLAAASLAQVHRAKTKTGEDVAVKVQRPGIGDIIETDIRILRDLASLCERNWSESRHYEPVQIVDEFARMIRRELDYIREGRNLQRFGKFFADDETIYIPKAYWDLTAPKVLTMEYIQGIKISELGQLQAAGLNRKTIAVNGANFILREVFEFHFFHADPHPGNIFVLENNVIAPVDFGMIGTLDEEIVRQLGIALTAIVENDADTLVNVLLKIGLAPEPINRRVFRAELADFLERYHELPLRQLIIKVIIEDLMDLARRHGLRFPQEMVMMVRALVVNQGVGTMLHPEFNIMEHARPYVQKLMMQRLDPARQLKEVSKLIGETASFLKKCQPT